MAKRGRPSKSGKRGKNGRLSRAKAAVLERNPDVGSPSAWVEERKRRFGTYYNSAIGRAYATGLLGEGQEAADRYQNARKFAALYARVIGKDRYRCALDTSPRGGISDHEVDLEQEAVDQSWLLVNGARIDETGCRPFVDQLLSTLYTDTGPVWLDTLLDGAKRADNHPDMMVLLAAIKGIDAIKPVDEMTAFRHEFRRRQLAA